MDSPYTPNPERPMNAAMFAWERLAHGGPAIFPEQVAIYRHLAHRLRGQRVVDVGCGMGIGTNVLAHWGCRVVGLDVSVEALQVARAVYPELTFLPWDITRGPIVVDQESTADACVAVEGIEHIGDAVIAIRHLLDSGRTLYVSTPNRAAPVLGHDAPRNAYHVREYTAREMLEWLGPAVIRDPFSWCEIGPDSLMTPLVYEVRHAR
mgnify:CR=1 FL=1